jgi:hypothetical protein
MVDSLPMRQFATFLTTAGATLPAELLTDLIDLSRTTQGSNATFMP